MDYGSEGHINIIGKFFGLTYILNPGMAFGLQFNLPYGKILLVGFRIILSLVIARVIFWKKEKISSLESLSLTFMLAGAIGNTIDCIFYGKFLHNAPFNAPFDWFYGQVIDMLDLHIFSGYLPRWIPFFGGNFVSLFPVGNVADVAVLISFGLLFFLSFTYNKKIENLDKKVELEK
jgi:signal peptidase II